MELGSAALDHAKCEVVRAAEHERLDARLVRHWPVVCCRLQLGSRWLHGMSYLPYEDVYGTWWLTGDREAAEEHAGDILQRWTLLLLRLGGWPFR